MSLIYDGFDGLDILYFKEKYVNAGKQFEHIDYPHNPLVFCNSLQFFRLLLSVPAASHVNGKFHMLRWNN